MAYHFNDNVYTKSFTPREPNIELLDIASEQNTIICLCNRSGKSFVANKLIQHVHNSITLRPGTIALYVADSPAVVRKQSGFIRRLTNLSVTEFDNNKMVRKKSEWKELIKGQVLIMSTQIALTLFKEDILSMSEINLLILHGCHCILRQGSVPMRELMKYYIESKEKPHLLGLASSIFVSGILPSEIEAAVNKMEDMLNCNAETASSVVSVLRYSTQPREVVLECGQREKCSVDDMIENEVNNAIYFLRDHRFNLNEMYEGYMDELDIPDPTSEPKEILTELLEIYRTLGPWSADRAALILLIHIEKLKVATPYERHFLLLCMTFSVILKIRAMLSDFFEGISDRDRVYKYTSPKILRLIEILRKFQPEKVQSDFDDSSDIDEDEISTRRVTGDSASENNPMREQDMTSAENLNCSKVTTTSKNNPRAAYPISIENQSNDAKNLMCNGTDSNNVTLTLNNFKSNKAVIVSSGVNIEIEDNSNPVLSCDKTVSENCENNHVDKVLNRDNFNQDHVVDNYVVAEKDSKQSVIQSLLENNDNSKITTEEDGDFLTGSVECVQKKNGFVPIGRKCLGLATKKRELKTMQSKFKKDSPINKTNSMESYLQCHEYLLLPKFKVDRYTCFERNVGCMQVRAMGEDDFLYKHMKNYGDVDVQQLCGLIFVDNKFTAKVLFQLLNDLKQCDEDFSFLSVHFTIGKLLDGNKDPKGAETEHRKQELVLKKFRTRECNLLIGTSFLEEGIDLPKCNLVVRFNVPKNYRSYVYTKERARAADSLFCILINDYEKEEFVEKLAEYFEMEQLLLRKCMNHEPKAQEEKDADKYVSLIQPFCPLRKRNSPYVDLSTAIAHLNRYCAKLPSDTFTCLTPLWNLKSVQLYGKEMFVCNIRLPINSPVKQEIKGYPMPTKVLARRFAAFQCCQLLHFEGELDDSLQPITKESFWLREEELPTLGSEEREEIVPKDSTEPRPGTTKRKQYYCKRIADSLTDCRPVVGRKSFLYHISMALTYPLPEEQNTRGRKIHAPEDSLQGFGILTCKTIPQIGAFPIFTRSGEVQVKLQLAQSEVLLSESQVAKIVDFIHYTFTSVLRLQRYLMMFDPTASENSYFIVPTRKEKDSSTVAVDWEFLELIYQKKNHIPTFIPDDVRKKCPFEPKEFEDAVVTPWYRNQDQPQYFYVAEICYNLSPKSSFPGTEYDTFEEYYLKKYGIQIQNTKQALLDVDHTSARLNFLTPRYVNRKGVALPTTSEEKKRAKRENLEEKQILVPELCNIHPFPGTLWRKAVCLPCILHRINALLLADQVRRIVANEIGVGIANLDPDFQWKPLDFGWSLSDVLAQSKASQQKREDKEKETNSKAKQETFFKTKELECISNGNDVIEIEEDEKNVAPWMEIGTWSNDMANSFDEHDSLSDGSDLTDDILLPQNITMIEGSKLNENSTWGNRNSSNIRDFVRYGSPTEWDHSRVMPNDVSGFFAEDSCSDDYLSDTSSSESDSDCGGLRIEFKDDNVAEAIESNKTETPTNTDNNEDDEDEPWIFDAEHKDETYNTYLKKFQSNIDKNKKIILNDGILYEKNREFDFVRPSKVFNYNSTRDPNNLEFDAPFGSSDNTFPELVDEIPEDLKNLPHTQVIIKSLREERKKRALELEKFDCCLQESLPNLNSEIFETVGDMCKSFSFDEQPDLNNHPGPSPSLILQALTMSNANDGINLERLETIGDSFLKYAITAYLYCTYENVHEGKLSHLRSKQVSNYSLYRLGHKKVLGESMIATKFEPHDNWLPPCYYIPRELERALIKTGLPASHWNRADLPSLRNLTDEEICQLVKEKGEKLGIVNSESGVAQNFLPCLNLENMPCFIPYNLMTQHSIPDKSIADCVEALIGAYLVACGPRGALLFMSWLGIKVLPKKEIHFVSKDDIPKSNAVGCTVPQSILVEEEEVWSQLSYGELRAPKPPLLQNVPDPEGELERLLRGFDAFEDDLQYHFRDRSYLLQALTHASYSPNRLTDCYQRLEFLGDAVLDYLITRHLYEDPRHHSPGALTDLRSALVNNTIFASLAVRHNFHKYFRHLCPGLNDVVDRFVRIQEENGHAINEEFYLIEEEECEEVEDVEVPKALGDIFESIAGAIFLDSGMSLDAVWRVYYRIMKKEIELFSTNVPKSPIREIFELEPETAQFGKPEKLADGKRVRVSVEVFGKGVFSGIGRNYRIAKCTAAKCALKKLKSKGLLEKKK